MKLLKHTIIPVAILSILGPTLHADTRMSRSAWTERSLELSSDPNRASMNSSIERFWNLPENTSTSPEIKTPVRSTRTHQSPPPKNNALDQKEQTRERRGYLGINLFNIIPIIDIETGSVSRNTQDSVSLKK